MEAPPLRCWKCDYELTGVAIDGECPGCGENIDPDKLAYQNPVLTYAALTTGLMSMLVVLSIALASAKHAGWRLYAATIALVVLTEALAQMSSTHGARPFSLRPETSLANLGRVFAIMALLWLAIELLFGLPPDRH